MGRGGPTRGEPSEGDARIVSVAWRGRGTLVVLGCMSVVYGSQLVIAGSTAETAAFRAATAATEWNAAAFTLLSPFLHSSHGHVFGNALGLLLWGGIVEREAGSATFVVGVYGSAMLANTLPRVVGAGSGVGISGALYALATVTGLVLVGRGITGLSRASEGRSWMRLVGQIVVGAGAVTLYPVRAVAQVAGALPVAAGVSTAGHLLGVAFGVVVLLFRVVSDGGVAAVLKKEGSR